MVPVFPLLRFFKKSSCAFKRPVLINAESDPSPSSVNESIRVSPVLKKPGAVICKVFACTLSNVTTLSQLKKTGRRSVWVPRTKMLPSSLMDICSPCRVKYTPSGIRVIPSLVKPMALSSSSRTEDSASKVGEVGAADDADG